MADNIIRISLKGNNVETLKGKLPIKDGVSTQKFVQLLSNGKVDNLPMQDILQNTGKTIRTTYKTQTDTSTQANKAVKVSDNKVLLIYANTYNSAYSVRARVAKFDGENIVFGTEMVLSSVDSYGGTYAQTITAVRIEDNKAFVSYNCSSSGVKARVLTINSDLSITAGTEVVINTAGTYYTHACLFDTNKILLSYSNGASSNYLTAVVLQVSGTTLISGTPVVIQSSSTKHICLVPISSTKILIGYNITSTYYVRLLTISDFNISAGSASALNFSGITDNTSTFINGILVNTNKALFTGVRTNDSYKLNMSIVTVNQDDTLSLGTAYTITDTSMYNPELYKISSNRVLLIAGQDKNREIFLDLNANTITEVSPLSNDNISFSTSDSTKSIVDLSNGNVIVSTENHISAMKIVGGSRSSIVYYPINVFITDTYFKINNIKIVDINDTTSIVLFVDELDYKIKALYIKINSQTDNLEASPLIDTGLQISSSRMGFTAEYITSNRILIYYTDTSNSKINVKTLIFDSNNQTLAVDNSFSITDTSYVYTTTNVYPTAVRIKDNLVAIMSLECYSSNYYVNLRIFSLNSDNTINQVTKYQITNTNVAYTSIGMILLKTTLNDIYLVCSYSTGGSTYSFYNRLIRLSTKGEFISISDVGSSESSYFLIGLIPVSNDSCIIVKKQQNGNIIGIRYLTNITSNMQESINTTLDANGTISSFNVIRLYNKLIINVLYTSGIVGLHTLYMDLNTKAVINNNLDISNAKNLLPQYFKWANILNKNGNLFVLVIPNLSTSTNIQCIKLNKLDALCLGYLDEFGYFNYAGVVNVTQSLIAGNEYYISIDGTLTKLKTENLAGVAISPNELLLTNDNLNKLNFINQNI